MTQEEALTILKTGANVFLTGEPGSGKTHVINRYVSWLREHKIEPSVSASTGIAASHIGGYTIHSWSGIGVRSDLSEWDLDAITQNERVVKRVRDARILIIDEVSMLSARTLSMVDTVCRAIRHDQRAFGGMQIILVGDFFQLPPVERVEEGSQDEMFGQSRARFAFMSPVWKSLNPIVCYLSEQHRQEDKTFLDFLNALRRGEVEESHIELLRKRYSRTPAADSTQLYSHNVDVDRINEVEIGKLESVQRIFDMTSQGSARLVDGLKRGCLSPERLTLREGARVMFTKNDPAGAFVNGTLGQVSGFDESGKPIVKTNSGKSLHVEEAEWTLQDGGKILAKLRQLPLRLAWAMTVHKSQGMSLDSAHMDLSGAFEYGQGYVALSRVRTLAGLSLAGLNKKALQVHPEVAEQDVVFRESSEKAQATFAEIPESELKAMQEQFIRACGGTIEKSVQKAPKEKTMQGKKYSLTELREKYRNAYRSWSDEEDLELRGCFEKGMKTREIADKLSRQPGAIRARLVKIGLVDARP